jgi:hypothetical protein
MPVTTYMQRHPRHDHGFTIPDPLLTKKFGIPNACNRCHQDRDADWALASVEQWFGAKMDRPARRRAESHCRLRAAAMMPRALHCWRLLWINPVVPSGRLPRCVCSTAGSMSRVCRQRFWDRL